MKENSGIRRLDFLPHDVQEFLTDTKEEIEEIRLRKGQHMVLTMESLNQSKPFIVTDAVLQEVINRATAYSLYAYQESLKNGFLTVRGGHRIGICGSAVIKDGQMQGFRYISSLNIRIASERKGVADFCADEIIGKNTLILSAPGCGKTTLLRDLVRQVSEKGKRISVADERSEICGMYQGTSQFDVGPNTDIMDGCPKAAAAVMLIKAMAPDFLAMDEILNGKDVQAVNYASHCGAHVILSAHALNYEDFRKKPLFHNLDTLNLIDQVIEIQKIDGRRTYFLKKWEGDSLA